MLIILTIIGAEIVIGIAISYFAKNYSWNRRGYMT